MTTPSADDDRVINEDDVIRVARLLAAGLITHEEGYRMLDELSFKKNASE